MRKKGEKPVQVYLPLAGGLVNHCFYVSEEELEGRKAENRAPALLEKALAGGLSSRSLSRHREELLREAIRSDRVEALASLLPQKRLSLEGFTELFTLAKESDSPDASAWLLEYRRAHYSPSEFDAFEQRRFELELGMAQPDERELRRDFRLRYLRSGAVICGVKAAQNRVEIPAMIGQKPVVGVESAAFYAMEPMPRVRRTFAAGEENLQAMGKAQAGDTVLLGRGISKKGGAESPIAWRVLRREEDRLLLLSEGAVALLPYHDAQEEVTWESCRLRRWLNTVFLPLCFPERERAKILPVSVETGDNPHFGSSGGAAAEDRLFLLSAEEAEALLPGDGARALGRWWWLRTPGFDNSFAATVTPEGGIVRIGSFVDTEDYAVRPAMWVDAGGQNTEGGRSL